DIHLTLWSVSLTASRTVLRCIRRMDFDDGYASQSRFVPDELQQLVERPLRAVDIAFNFNLAFRLAHPLQILYHNDAAMITLVTQESQCL
ncbi:MAG: hypothetical protein WCA20_17525, partial [Candidatus Sulfotelmatobacter sp.]